MTRALTGAIIAAVLAIAPATAAARTEPPRATEIARKTDRFLAKHAQSGPVPRAGTGGIGGTFGGDLFPDSRVVCFYGAPQMGQTVLGMNSIAGAARRLAIQAEPYEALGDRPVIGEFDLVSVFATAGGGPDGLYRTRQSEDVIALYLAAARKAGGRLMLDIQPGRSTFSKELTALGDWAAEPDVDIAIDPEWNVGRRGIPGRTPGKVTAGQVNALSKRLAAIVRENGLPPKVLVVHQFRRGSVLGRTKIKQRRGVQVLLNFDGIGGPGPKEAGYASLAAPKLFAGFSLFYQRDRPLMKPSAVLGLDPEPDFLLYQ